MSAKASSNGVGEHSKETKKSSNQRENDDEQKEGKGKSSIETETQEEERASHRQVPSNSNDQDRQREEETGEQLIEGHRRQRASRRSDGESQGEEEQLIEVQREAPAARNNSRQEEVQPLLNANGQSYDAVETLNDQLNLKGSRPKEERFVEFSCIGPCVRCSTKCIIKHRKICVAILMIFGIILLALSAVFTLGILHLCEDVPSNQKLYLPPKTLIEIDPKEYNIITFKQQITVSCSNLPQDESISVIMSHDSSWEECTLEETVDQSKSFLRYWSNKHLPKGAILLYPNTSYIMWSWSNLTTPPLDHTCNNNESQINTSNDELILVYDIYKTRRNDEEIVKITFCSNESFPDMAKIKMIEYLPNPIPQKSLSCKEEAKKLPLNNIFKEVFKSSKLYFNTSEVNTDDDTEIDLKVTRNTRACYYTIGGTGVVLVLTIIFFTLSFTVCCCCKNKKYIKLGYTPI